MAQHRLLFRFLADLARVAAAVGALAALVGIPSFGMEARFLLVLLVLMVPRATGGVPAPLDFAFGATLLVALWTSTAAWYGTTPVADVKRLLAQAPHLRRIVEVAEAVAGGEDPSATGREPEPPGDDQHPVEGNEQT